jgi:excisionase family DNA binding protein
MASKKPGSNSTVKKTARSSSTRITGKAGKNSSGSSLSKSRRTSGAGAKKAAATALSHAPAKKAAAKQTSHAPVDPAPRSGKFSPTANREGQLAPARGRGEEVTQRRGRVEQVGRPPTPQLPALVLPRLKVEPELRALRRQMAQALPLFAMGSQLQALRRSAQTTARGLNADGLRDLGSFLREATDATLSVGRRSVALPADLLTVLAQVVETLERGHALTLVESIEPDTEDGPDASQIAMLDLDQELTSQQAADMLNVSRPHVVKLATSGQLPYRKVGNRHRFALGDVLSHDEQMRAVRDEALRSIAPEGGYAADDF